MTLPDARGRPRDGGPIAALFYREVMRSRSQRWRAVLIELRDATPNGWRKLFAPVSAQAICAHMHHGPLHP